MSRSSDPCVLQGQPIIEVKAFRLRGKTRSVQGPVKELTGTVACEHTSSTISTMRTRGQSENQQTGRRISERRHGPSPVVPIEIRPAFDDRNLSAVFAESRTPFAANNLAIQNVEGIGQITKINTIALTNGFKHAKMRIPAAPRTKVAGLLKFSFRGDSPMKDRFSLLFQTLILVLATGVATVALADTPPTTTPPAQHKTVQHKKKAATTVHPKPAASVVTMAAVTEPKTAAVAAAPKKKVWVQTWDEPTYKDSTAADKIDGEDLVVRKAAVDALGPLNGSVVVTDPSTGRILTIVNQPLALGDGFQPCSTVKVSVALAALHEGLVARTSPIRFNSKSSLDLTDALAYSNNYYFANLGIKLGYDRMSYYAHLYGYGEKAGLNIEGEHPGSWPPAPPKNGGMGMLTSFGEEISQTPLELAALVGAVANGGTLYWMQYPRSQAEISEFRAQVKRKLDIGKYIDKIKPGMKGAVEFGTARRAKQDDEILGKTGTCSEGRTHLGWFGSFNDDGARKLVVVVMLTGGRPSIGSMAATVAGDVYKELASKNFLRITAPLTPAAILPPELLSGRLPN